MDDASVDGAPARARRLGLGLAVVVLVLLLGPIALMLWLEHGSR